MEREEAIRTVMQLLSGIGVPDEAHEAHEVVAQVLSGSGWSVRREVRVVSRGDGSGGRVDIEATQGGQVVGIEIDRSRPRRKSVAKLRTRDWIRVLALRDPDPLFNLAAPEDLVVIPLRAQQFTGWAD